MGDLENMLYEYENDTLFWELVENLGKPKEPISEEEQAKIDLEIEEMGAHLNDFEWWAKRYPEEFGPLYKEIQEEQAELAKNKKE